MKEEKEREETEEIRVLMENKIDEFIRKFGREPGACEVREMQLEAERAIERPDGV